MTLLDWTFMFSGWVIGLATPFFMIGYCLLHAKYKEWVKKRKSRFYANIKINF